MAFYLVAFDVPANCEMERNECWLPGIQIMDKPNGTTKFLLDEHQYWTWRRTRTRPVTSMFVCQSFVQFCHSRKHPAKDGWPRCVRELVLPAGACCFVVSMYSYTVSVDLNKGHRCTWQLKLFILVSFESLSFVVFGMALPSVLITKRSGNRRWKSGVFSFRFVKTFFESCFSSE